MIDFYSDDIPSFFDRPRNYHVRSPLLLTYPLNYAAARGDVASVRDLINMGVDVNSRGDMQETALHEAISAGSIPVVQLLLSAGARTDLRDSFGRTPVDLAITTGSTELIEIIHSQEFNPKSISINEIATLYIKDYDFANETWNISAPNEFGEFPIHIAVRRSSLEELRAFIAAKCNINAQTADEMKYSALHYAAGTGNLEIIKYLLANRIDHTLIDGLNRTATDLIYLNGKSENILFINKWLTQDV